MNTKHIEEILINGKPLSHYSGAVEKITELAIKIHEEAIKELEGRKQTDDNQMSFDHAFDEGINEAITYHKEEIMKLAEPKAIYAKTNEGDVYLKD